MLIIAASLLPLVAVVAAAAVFRWRPARPEHFEENVADLERRLMHPASEGVVLLAGSSYFELWETSAKDLAGLDTLNVGVGGTRIGDQIHYVDRLVFPFNPRALVVYAGSNDISGIPFFSRRAEQVVSKVKEYVSLVHDRYPELPIFYVAITEAPLREKVRAEIQKANHLLSEWAEETGEVTFIDTAPALLTVDGRVDESLFGHDRLHLNKQGYDRFAAAISAVLLPALVQR